MQAPEYFTTLTQQVGTPQTVGSTTKKNYFCRRTQGELQNTIKMATCLASPQKGSRP